MCEYTLAWHICSLCREYDEFLAAMKNIFSRISERHYDVCFFEEKGEIFIKRNNYFLKCRTDENGEDIRREFRKKYNVNVNFKIVCCFEGYGKNNYCPGDLAADFPLILKDRNDYIIMINGNGAEQFRVTGYEGGYGLFWCDDDYTLSDMYSGRTLIRDPLENEKIVLLNIFEKEDKIIESAENVKKYAEEHFEEIFASARSADRTVLTTNANWLGLADPSLIEHRVVRGRKRGRVIKEIPESGEYTKILYKGEKPAAVCRFYSHGREDGYFFFDFDGFTWAADIVGNNDSKYYGKILYGDIFRLKYDDKGRIASRYHITGASFIGEDYEYPEDENAPIKCIMRDYVSKVSGSSRSIPAGYPHSPMRERYYEISPDLKIIREYAKDGEEFVFCREYKPSGKKSAKPKPADDTYERLSEWLDVLLSDIPENAKGLFLCLDEGTEDGYGITPFFTSRFDRDDEDWACDEISGSKEFFVSVNGTLEWEEILKITVRFLRKYVKEGGKNKLNPLEGAGVGFSDGNITLIYKKR